MKISTIKIAWLAYFAVRRYRRHVESVARVINYLIADDENAKYYQLDEIFAKNPCLKNKRIIKIIENTYADYLSERERIFLWVECEKVIRGQCGHDVKALITTALCALILHELTKCFDILDSMVFALSEVLSYAKNKQEAQTR